MLCYLSLKLIVIFHRYMDFGVALHCHADSIFLPYFPLSKWYVPNYTHQL